MRNAPGTFIWYELLTRNPDAAADFYGKVVGWQARGAGQPGMDYRLWSIGGVDVGGLMKMPEMDMDQPIWLGYVGVDDVDAAVAKLSAAGGAVHMRPTDIPGVGRFAFVADPQGALFYIMRGDCPEPGRAFEPTTPGHGAWNELLAQDWQAAFDFYGGQFGWTKAEALDLGPMGTYQLIAAGGTTIGAMMNMPRPGRPLWIYYFVVSDIERARVAIEANGGAVLQGPSQVPGGRWILQARDPQEALFALVGPANSAGQPA